MKYSVINGSLDKKNINFIICNTNIEPLRVKTINRM